MFTPIIVYIINQDINIIPIYLTLGKEIVLPTIHTIKDVLLSIKDVSISIKVGCYMLRDFLCEIQTIFVICFLLGLYGIIFYPNEVKTTFSEAFEPILSAISEVKSAIIKVYNDFTSKMTIQVIAQLGLVLALMISFPVVFSELGKLLLKNVK
jgi:hypothetical protein